MPSLQRLVETDRNSIDSPTGPLSRKVIITTDSQAYDFSRPIITIVCAMSLGFIIAFKPHNTFTNFSAAAQLHRLSAWYSRACRGRDYRQEDSSFSNPPVCSLSARIRIFGAPALFFPAWNPKWNTAR
jgi:hypothetical protein